MSPSTPRLKRQLSGNDIETQSFRIIAESCDLSRFGRATREIAARIVHACADPSILDTLVLHEEVALAAIAALAGGATIIADVEMVRRALYSPQAVCALDFAPAHADGQKTRTQLGMENAVLENPGNPVLVIGCAPTALASVIELAASKAISPAALVAMPVGFVGAAEWKESLIGSGLPALTNQGPRGGSAVTAAAFNALARMAGGRFSFEEATR